MSLAIIRLVFRKNKKTLVHPFIIHIYSSVELYFFARGQLLVFIQKVRAFPQLYRYSLTYYTIINVYIKLALVRSVKLNLISVPIIVTTNKL